jgi:hypothetical protein
VDLVVEGAVVAALLGEDARVEQRMIERGVDCLLLVVVAPSTETRESLSFHVRGALRTASKSQSGISAFRLARA